MFGSVRYCFNGTDKEQCHVSSTKSESNYLCIYILYNTLVIKVISRYVIFMYSDANCYIQ